MEEKISVIVPVYNVEKYIDKCIESIKEQTYNNLEIILINDGSIDGSYEKCKKHAQTDSRIKLISQKNKGQAVARNNALKVATGEYITFVDSDDFIDNTMLSEMFNCIKKFNADLVQFKSRKIYADYIEQTQDTKKVIVCNNEETLNYFVHNQYFTSSVCYKLFKKNIIDMLKFPEGKIHEDEYFSFHSYYNSNISIYKDVTSYNVNRVRNDSTMTKKFNKSRLDLLDIIDERIEFLKYNKKDRLSNVCKMKYLQTLILFYCLSKDYNIDSLEKNLISIKEKFNKHFCYKYILTSNELNFRNKINILVFKIDSDIYYKIRKFKGNTNETEK